MPPTQRAWILFLVLANSPSLALKSGDFAGWGLREDTIPNAPHETSPRVKLSETIDVARVRVDQMGRVHVDTGEQWDSLAECIAHAVKGKHLTANADFLGRDYRLNES